MSDSPSRSSPLELAELYVCGAVTDEERERFEQGLDERDAACVAELERVRAVATMLAESVPAVPPPPRVREALGSRLARTGSAPAFSAVSEADPTSEERDRWVVLRGAELDWRETGVPGVRARNLFIDRRAGRLTLLIRMDPGAHYPNHDHPDAEECMVLDGDLHIADTVLRTFDYLRTPPGGDHGEPWTETGCLLLVTCAIAA